jgi:imidazolonepropionase-like amidohydrolase
MFLRIRYGAALIIAIAAFVSPQTRASEILPPGFRPLPHGVHALVDARIVTRPGKVIEKGTIVIRDGFIESAGPEIKPPDDARIWPMAGTTIYAGFIDPYVVAGTNGPIATEDSEPVSRAQALTSGINFYGVSGQQTDRGNPGPGYEVQKITPEFKAVRDYSPSEKLLEPLREIGFTAAVIAPGKGILRGSSGLVALSDENPNEAVLRPELFQHVAFETHQTGERVYPGSLMGVIASIRQSFMDAKFYTADLADFAKNPRGRKRPEYNSSLEALAAATAGKRMVMFEPGSALMDDRAARLARELGLNFALVSCGQEWRRPDLAKAAAATFIVPLRFPSLPKLPSDSDWEQVGLDSLRAWDWAPENPAVLRKQGVEIALTTYGLSDKKKFRANLRLAIDRGLSEEDALAALTIVPAKLCGVDEQLGTIEPGKIANLVVVTGENYFSPDAKVREVWIDGRVYNSSAEDPKAGATDATKLQKPVSPEEGEPGRPKAKPGEPEPAAITAAKTNAPAAETKSTEKKPKESSLQKTRTARSPMEGRGPITNPAAIFVSGATIWTCGPEGILTNADMIISNGKIQSVGKSLSAPAAALVIDGKDLGLNVTPGLIDCHSHTAILGSVNESTIPSTAMVRIHDVVNSETEHIYQQLAGGVTTVNLLHGSANPIGGQNCVIKLKDGAGPEDLVFAAAPPGIKFALGENVKQSNWGDRNSTRFPQTRMGVRTFIANRFAAAQEYLKDRKAAQKEGKIGPRPDLELEAIGEIIEGKRLIHCHSYRQDEILMLMRLMESYGVKIGTFQHALEGYKIADEIAKHGAGASTFADWWAYKFEVYDAIPYNASLMNSRGVVVSLNSDSSDLARHLYTEAAKSVKFGGTSEAEALKFVTLNPAKQLHIDKFVGSLEPGKDADFTIWSRSPLDSTTVCEQTWIEGKKYFDRAEDENRTSRLRKERTELIDKAKRVASGSSSKESTKSSGSEAAEFFHESLEHEFDAVDRGCLDGEEER